MGDDWGEDAPPPLSSLPDQIHAAQLTSSIIGTAGLQAAELREAAVTQVAAGYATASKPFKRGFLDVKHLKSSKTKQVTSGKEQLPFLKAQQASEQQKKQIPDFLKLEPSEQQQQYATMKTQLVKALAPTPETVAAVDSDATLKSGFDDPEVMEAVAEVAANPSAFTKYANNAKVVKFYQAFGNLMGNKLASWKP